MITWDTAFETYDTNLTYIFDYDNDVRNAKEAIKERFEKEHVWKTGNTDGQHIPGKVRILLVGTKADIIASSGFSGAFGFASDTKELLRCTADGVFWYVIDLDHSILSGLLDDDHAIYLKVDGTRALSGNVSAGSNKITTLDVPTLSGDLVTKKYTDDLSATLLKDVLYHNEATSVIRTEGAFITALSMTIAINNTEDLVKINGFAVAGYGYYNGGPYDETIKMKITIGGTVYAYGQRKPVESCQQAYDFHNPEDTLDKWDATTKPSPNSLSLCCFITGLGVGNKNVLLEISDGTGYTSGIPHVAWFNRAIQAYIVRKI